MNDEISITVNQTPLTKFIQPHGSIELVVANEAVDKLITEGGDDFYNFVNRIGLVKDPSLIVLSSRHSYYYDNEEMTKAKTVINLTELNNIKEIKVLMQSYLQNMSQECNFVGCFINNKKFGSFVLRKGSSFTGNTKIADAVELGIVSRYPFINMIYSIMDLKSFTYLSERSVTLMLRNYGFKVLDMAEINGLTFFHSQKIKNILN